MASNLCSWKSASDSRSLRTTEISSDISQNDVEERRILWVLDGVKMEQEERTVLSGQMSTKRFK